MWSLIPFNEAEGGQRFRLLVGKKYTLGRQSADFTITNDKSISRIHATLEVTHPETNVSHPHKPPVFTVRDSSKFGTVVRDEKIVNAEQLVKNGDRVKFGTVNSIYSTKYRFAVMWKHTDRWNGYYSLRVVCHAVYEPYVVTTSCLDQVNKRQTKTLITQLGGHVVSDWRKECQLLIMTSLSVTVKVICALVSLRPIVTVQYLQDLTECIGAGRPLPNPEDYTPPLAESQLNPNEVSFKKDERRRTLFQGKTFVFLNPKQFKKLNVAVECAGGKPYLMEEGTDDNKDDILVQPTTCVMHADPNDTNNLSQNAHEWVKHVFKVLRKRGLRAIPDCELGFAVLYCSTERYCNPSLDCLPSQAVNLPSQSLSQQVAPPSQSQHPTQQAPATPSNRTPARTNRAGPSTPKLPVKVKDEPVSQTAAEKTSSTSAATSTTSKNLNKKRQRSEDDTNEDSNAAKIPRIKDEAPSPIPPRRSARRSPSPVPISPARSRHADSPESSSHSASPSPPPRKSARGAKSTVDGLIPKRSTSPAPRRSARSRSPSPAPQAHSPVARRAQGAIKSSRSPSPAPSPVVSPKSEPVSDELDDFDAFEPRSRRRRSPAPAAVTKIERPSPARDQGKTQSAASNKTNTATVQKNDTKRSKRKAEDDDIEPVAEKKPRLFVRDSPVRDRVPEVNNDLSDEQRQPQTEHILPDGFLTTRVPIKDQVEARDRNIVDHDLPADAGTVVASADLTVPRRPRPTVIAENNNIINGKAVKNFKKFKKVAGAGAAGLPRILGGADLRPHINDARKVDTWFEEERQEQEKETAADKAADDMFSWEPSKVKKKTTTRRR